jgi:hypothetical protein
LEQKLPRCVCDAMDKAEAYLDSAAECLRLAKLASERANKVLLLEVADRWLRLATRAERTPQRWTAQTVVVLPAGPNVQVVRNG